MVFSGAGFERVKSPIPLRFQGVLPHLSSNALGYFACVVALWSLARLLGRGRETGPRPWVSGALVVFGLVTLKVAQYRTGYAMFAAGVAVLLMLAGKKALAAVAVAGVLLMSVAGGGMFEEAQPYLLRGQDTERARRLSGRLTHWSSDLPVWRESPIIGAGLETVSRLVVLTNLEGGKKEAQNIHQHLGRGARRDRRGRGHLARTRVSSLVEAGPGACFRRASRIVPAVILTAMSVRSLTGGSIQGGGDTQLFFLTLAIGLRDGVTLKLGGTSRLAGCFPERAAHSLAGKPPGSSVSR